MTFSGQKPICMTFQASGKPAIKQMFEQSIINVKPPTYIAGHVNHNYVCHGTLVYSALTDPPAQSTVNQDSVSRNTTTRVTTSATIDL